MEKREQEADSVKYLIDKLRNITITVQIAPFAYTFVYILAMILYSFSSESVLNALDTLFYISPFIICIFLIESHILKLCKWHKFACLLPIIPQIFVFIDYYIIEFTKFERIISIFIPTIMSVLLLVAAYKVFFK